MMNKGYKVEFEQYDVYNLDNVKYSDVKYVENSLKTLQLQYIIYVTLIGNHYSVKDYEAYVAEQDKRLEKEVEEE